MIIYKIFAQIHNEMTGKFDFWGKNYENLFNDPVNINKKSGEKIKSQHSEKISIISKQMNKNKISENWSSHVENNSKEYTIVLYKQLIITISHFC